MNELKFQAACSVLFDDNTPFIELVNAKGYMVSFSVETTEGDYTPDGFVHAKDEQELRNKLKAFQTLLGLKLEYIHAVNIEVVIEFNFSELQLWTCDCYKPINLEED